MILRPQAGSVPTGPHGDVRVLPRAPVTRGLLAHGGIGIVQQPAVGVGEAAVPIGGRNTVAEPCPLGGEEPADVAGDPLHFAAPCVGDGEQDQLADPLRVPFGVGEPEGGAPGPAEHQPLRNVQVAPQDLDVRDQMGGGVGAQIDDRGAGVGRAAAAPALVEQHDAVGAGIEIPAPCGRAPGTGTAVEHDGRFAVRVPAHLPVDELPVADIQHAVFVGVDLRIELGHSFLSRPVPAPRSPRAHPASSSRMGAGGESGESSLSDIVGGRNEPARHRDGRDAHETGRRSDAAVTVSAGTGRCRSSARRGGACRRRWRS